MLTTRVPQDLLKELATACSSKISHYHWSLYFLFWWRIYLEISVGTWPTVFQPSKYLCFVVIQIWRPLWEVGGGGWGMGGGVRQKWGVIVIERRGWGVSECSGRPIFISFIKENWICAITRHHAKPNINILLTRNLHFDSYLRPWSHPLHCSWAKSNNGMRGQFECDVTHARCGCSIVCLRFQVVQIK